MVPHFASRRPRLTAYTVVSLLLSVRMGAAIADTIPGADSLPASTHEDLWQLAHQHAATLRFSTLFTAQDVRRYLSQPRGIEEAVTWCRKTGVTHVYLETFRGGYTADRATILNAREQFRQAGFLVSGCVTTTQIGRKSVKGWIFPCFTEQAGRDKLRQTLEYTAGLFDEIMIDDFLATACECEECIRARGDQPWDRFRCELMADVSTCCILEPARKVNPSVKVIIKYPQWYDEFHERGYDVVRQTRLFDRIWVGTETRNPDSEQWGRKSQYEAYFIMRWLGEIGGAKCGGGWFDPLGTSPPVYVEQARQTVLAGAREALLFCYGNLQTAEGRADVDALREELSELFSLSRLIQGRAPRGICAPKPPNSPAHGDRYVYDYVALLGLPLVPATRIDRDAPALFLPVQAAADADLPAPLAAMLTAGRPGSVDRRAGGSVCRVGRPEGTGRRRSGCPTGC